VATTSPAAGSRHAGLLTSLLRVVVACVEHDSWLVWEGGTMKDLRCLIGWDRCISTRSGDGTGGFAECSRRGENVSDSGALAGPRSSLSLRVFVGVA
jgi:hypothetical protein